jgi:hypothetical protein
MSILKCCVMILMATAPLMVLADPAIDARDLASRMIQQLGGALKKEIGANGPAGAVSVCRDMAPAIAGEMSRKSGGRVARVSLKTRNPLLGDPDAWEQQVLMEFDRKAAAGENIESLEYAAMVDEPGGRYFRYMKALPVQPLCLSCHGAAENIPDPVKSILASDYPHDHAVGYAIGQIRGAVTIKQPAGNVR